MTVESADAPVSPETPEAVPPPPPPPEPLRPVSSSERVETIDILRGLALFGILAANIRGFSGPPITYFLPHLFWTGMADRIAQAFVDTFIQGKFITIFAFLFGVGFAVQFDRATQRGAKFGGTYARRMAILLVFGLIHGILIWFGDILLVYALDGFVLIAFRKRKNKTLIIWAAIAATIIPLIMTSAFIASQLGAKMPDMRPPAAEIQRATEIYANGSWLEVQRLRASDAVKHNWAFFPILFWQVLSLFLLGMLAWRKRFFYPSPESLPRYRKAMFWGLLVGIGGNLTMTVTRFFDPTPMPRDWLGFAMVPVQVVAVPALSLGYICFVILLCHDPQWRARLHRFAAVGRTALTNYLLQAVIGTTIFYGYGLGLFGVGPALLIPWTFAIFIAQMYASSWWIARYRFGPVEWLWRRLTYGGPLPMRREKAVVAPEEVAA